MQVAMNSSILDVSTGGQERKTEELKFGNCCNKWSRFPMQKFFHNRNNRRVILQIIDDAIRIKGNHAGSFIIILGASFYIP